jgi:membrane protease subunit HflK
MLAQEDEQRYKNQAEAYALDILPRARGDATRLREAANAYREQIVAKAEGEASRFTQTLTEYEKAPEVTRKRMYLETMEYVLSNTSKVIMQVKSGNSMTYIPLDRLMQNRNDIDAGTEPNNPGTVNPVPDLKQDSRLRSSSRSEGAR